MKLLQKILFIFILLAGTLFVGCKNDEKTPTGDPVVEPTPEETPQETPEEVKYVVTFDVDGAKTTAEVKEGEKAVKPADPVKEGYTFLGWYLGDTAYDFETVVTADVTLVAKFEEVKEPTIEVKFVVTFDVDGEKTTAEVKEGEKAVKPADPVKEGYTFLGWYVEDSLYDFEAAVTSDVTLVAKFEEVKYVVTFDADGETTTTEVKEGEKAVKPADPVKEGYIFLGWYLGEEAYDFEVIVTADVTLVAKFEEDRQYYSTTELKDVLNTIVQDYINSLNGSLKIELSKGESVTLIDLIYNYKDNENVESLKYEVTGAVSSHVYVKKDVVYVLSNGVTSQEELTSSSSDLLINSYGVSTILLPTIKFYDEKEFYDALQFVSFEENLTKYSLNLNDYSGSKVNAAGKESIDLYVKLDGEKIVYIEFVSTTLDSVNKVKVEFLGLEKATITYPDNLSSYGE